MRQNLLGESETYSNLRAQRNSLNRQISDLKRQQDDLSAVIRRIQIRIADKEAELRALGSDTFNPQMHDPVDADRRRRGRERPKTPWDIVAHVVSDNVQDVRRRSLESDIRNLRRDADPFIRERMRITAQRNDLIAERAQTVSEMRNIRCVGV